MNNLKITPVIGVEVHVELETMSKMFCGCPAGHFDTVPNSQTCPVCLGLPGALPVANKKAIEDTVLIGMALGSEIAAESKFDRKNYFYPDLAKGYQISQYDQPLCSGGYLELDSGKKVGIERVHLEEDTGKLQHGEVEGEKVSLIDFNRSGVPLVEIVSKPQMNSAEEVKEYLKKIRQLIVWLKVSRADMEKGQMRLEPTVNVRIEKDGEEFLTPLCEIKNINSFNFAAAAIEYEIKRQVKEWEETKEVKSGRNKTTRGYDPVRKVTFLQRSKEEAADYRYFPEPDIPPLKLNEKLLREIKGRMPKLPAEVGEELKTKGIRMGYVKVILDDEDLLKYVQGLAELVKGEELDTVVGLLVNGKEDWRELESRELLLKIKTEKTEVVDDEAQIEEWVEKAMAENQVVVADYQGGKENALMYLVGQVMRLSGGKAKAEAVKILLMEKLAKS